MGFSEHLVESDRQWFGPVRWVELTFPQIPFQLLACVLLFYSAGAAPQQEFQSQFQQGLPRHIRQFSARHQGVDHAPTGGARSLFDSIVSKINAGHRENARSNPNYNPNIGTEAPLSASAPVFRPAPSFQAQAPRQEQPNLTPAAFNQFNRAEPSQATPALSRPPSPETSQRRLPAPVPFRRQQPASSVGQSPGATKLGFSLFQGQHRPPQQQPLFSERPSTATVAPRLRPTTTTTIAQPATTPRRVDVEAEYAALLEAHRLANLEHQRRQLELLEEQKKVIEEQRKAQLLQQQELEEKVAEEKERRFTQQQNKQLLRQQENAVQVEKLDASKSLNETVTPKARTAATKPRRIRLRITNTSTLRPVTTSTTAKTTTTRPTTILAPTPTTSTTKVPTTTTTTTTTTTHPPIIVPSEVSQALGTLSAYLDPSSGEGAQLLEAPDHIWIALKELAHFLKRGQHPL